MQPAGWAKAKDQVVEVAHFLLYFLKNPLRGMQTLPHWDPIRSLIFLAMIAIPSGLLGGLVSRSPIMMIWGIILLPLLSVISTAIVTAILYYAFHFVYRTQMDPLRLFLIVVVASTPFMLVRVLVLFIPFLVVIAVASSALLLVVGISENLQIPRPKVLKLVGTFFAVFFVFWMIQTMHRARMNRDSNDRISPEAVEQLEKEFGP